uniref:Uncharacterized protein n=1 Tax=Anopheles atroparvus TaxID=41427 RepID=A0AAG5DNZ4_ANOAO
MTCPNQRILPAFATVRISGSPNSSASSWFILLLHPSCTYTPPKIVRSTRRSKMPSALASSVSSVQDSC